MPLKFWAFNGFANFEENKSIIFKVENETRLKMKRIGTENSNIKIMRRHIIS